MKRLVSKLKRALRPKAPTPDTILPPVTDAEPPKPKRKSTGEPKPRCDSRLESLIPEVRRQILSSLDLPALKAVVHASPTFHQQYLFDRAFLLRASLQNTLGSASIDALAAYQHTTLSKDASQHEFLQLYSNQSSPQITQDEAQKMVCFYFQSVKPFIEYFACSALCALAKEAGMDVCSQVTLTATEELRLTRAIYRFHLLVRIADPGDKWSETSRAEELRTFIGFFEPWEVEELLSLYEFAPSIYKKILEDIRWDLHQDNPKFDDQDRPPTPEGAVDLHDSFQIESYAEGLCLHGLPLLSAVLFKIKDHEDLVSMMLQHMPVSTFSSYTDIRGVFEQTDQEERRHNRPSERDRMHDQEVPMPFRGDSEHQPPLAWTILWDTYTYLYGCYTSTAMRRWGYVFWDAERLESYGAKEVLQLEWGRRWLGMDPRETLW